MNQNTLLELKTRCEESVRVAIEDWPRSQLLTAYFYLSRRGCSLVGIEREIVRALEDEQKNL